MELDRVSYFQQEQSQKLVAIPVANLQLYNKHMSYFLCN